MKRWNISPFQDLYFIRCILPNNEKQRDKFERDLILQQLNTSSTISYAKFIRYGYPKHVALQLIIDACKSIENKLVKPYVNRLDFCTKIIMFVGLKLQDFKIANDTIFVRLNKFTLLETFFSGALAAKGFQEMKTAIYATNLPIPRQILSPK